MLHQLEIGLVVNADVIEVIAKQVAASEVLFVTTKAAVHGVAPGVDNDGLRKNLVNQAYLLEVGW